MSKYLYRRYAVYLSSRADPSKTFDNAYGYWTGKDYTCSHEKFPVCVADAKNECVRLYDSLARAQRALGAATGNKYSYVASGYVEDVFTGDRYFVTQQWP